MLVLEVELVEAGVDARVQVLVEQALHRRPDLLESDLLLAVDGQLLEQTLRFERVELVLD